MYIGIQTSKRFIIILKPLDVLNLPMCYKCTVKWIFFYLNSVNRNSIISVSGADSGFSDECDNESLYAPPPAYDEVINSNMYPVTLEQRRVGTFRRFWDNLISKC